MYTVCVFTHKNVLVIITIKQNQAILNAYFIHFRLFSEAVNPSVYFPCIFTKNIGNALRILGNTIGIIEIPSDVRWFPRTSHWNPRTSHQTSLDITSGVLGR